MAIFEMEKSFLFSNCLLGCLRKVGVVAAIVVAPAYAHMMVVTREALQKSSVAFTHTFGKILAVFRYISTLVAKYR